MMRPLLLIDVDGPSLLLPIAAAATGLMEDRFHQLAAWAASLPEEDHVT